MQKQVSEELIKAIVKEVMAQQRGDSISTNVEEKSGVMSVSGSSVKCEAFDTGKTGDQVYLKDVFTSKENKNLAAGFMEMRETDFEWTLKYDEVDYIIEGTLTIKINGKEISGSAGDVILIPAGSSIVFSVKDYAKFLYVTYPANWAEL